MVREINRTQIETIIKKYPVIYSQIIQDHKSLAIIFGLSNDKKCMVKYSLNNQQKSYFSDSP